VLRAMGLHYQASASRVLPFVTSCVSPNFELDIF
jgi:hypothetical protein